MDGIHRYVTAENNGGAHIFTAVLDPNFERQIWRKDQGHVANLISLGKSGRYLQADVKAKFRSNPMAMRTTRTRHVDSMLSSSRTLTLGAVRLGLRRSGRGEHLTRGQGPAHFG